MRRSRMGALYRAQSLSVGQPQVEQNDVDGVFGKIFLSVAHALQVGQLSIERFRLVQHLTEQPGVSWVVLKQKHRLDGCIPHQWRACCGNLTFLSQKSVMFFMRASNSSNCTGFVT